MNDTIKGGTRLTLNLTDAQREALDKAKQNDSNAPKSNSELLRRLVEQYIVSHGVEFPENDNTWGGKRRG